MGIAPATASLIGTGAGLVQPFLNRALTPDQNTGAAQNDPMQQRAFQQAQQPQPQQQPQMDPVSMLLQSQGPGLQQQLAQILAMFQQPR